MTCREAETRRRKQVGNTRTESLGSDSILAGQVKPGMQFQGAGFPGAS